MNHTQEYQRQVKCSMEKYLLKKLKKFSKEKKDEFKEITDEYIKQLDHIKREYEERSKCFANYSVNEEVILSCISEPSTFYTKGYCGNNKKSPSIYSPRIDIAISPIIKKRRGKHESIGVYYLTENVKLYKKIHKIPFVKELEKKFREISNENMKGGDLYEFNLDIYEHEEFNYKNKRPLHLFGIEIENQRNPKHLMGDFLNAVNLSLIPIVVVPKDNLINVLNMLEYNKIIEGVKDVKTYSILKQVLVLTISQFTDTLNNLLVDEGIETIKVNGYD